MALSKEELLIPRYKVIADWPGVAGKVCVGDIFQPDPEDEGMFWIDGEPFQEDKLRDYPHLFIKLEWWEERKPEDFPEYVVSIEKKIGCVEVKKVKECDGLFISFEGQHIEWRIDHALPATIEEYNTYINSKNLNK